MNVTGKRRLIRAKTEPTGPRGFTYFVRRADAIKIGHSGIPKQRISTLQVSFPEAIEVLAIVPNARVSEAAAHAKFAHLRLSGEWFRAEPELLDFIKSIKGPDEFKPKRPDPTTGSLIALRDKHGPYSPIGYGVSNLLKQMKALKTYVRPAWATHESQTLQWEMKRQVERLERLTKQLSC